MRTTRSSHSDLFGAPATAIAHRTYGRCTVRGCISYAPGRAADQLGTKWLSIDGAEDLHSSTGTEERRRVDLPDKGDHDGVNSLASACRLRTTPELAVLPPELHRAHLAPRPVLKHPHAYQRTINGFELALHVCQTFLPEPC